METWCMDYRVLDGGMASELTKLGYKIDGDPLWSARMIADCPEAVKGIHLRFLESGSDVIETATYQATIKGYLNHLHINEEEATDLMYRGVRIAKEACEEFWHNNSQKASGRKKPMVVGGIGPYGASQHDGSEYHGNYVDNMTKEALMDWHRPQIRALVDGGVEMLAFETIPAQKEGEAMVDLLQEFPGIKAWLTFCCKDEHHTAHGEVFSTAVMSSVGNSSQVVAVGVNCCSPIHVKSLLASLQGKTSLPLIAYPNKGEEWIDSSWKDTGLVRPFATFLDEWIAVGARWIGGCCRTTLSDLIAIRKKMDSLLEAK